MVWWYVSWVVEYNLLTHVFFLVPQVGGMIGASCVNFNCMFKKLVKVYIPFHPLTSFLDYLTLVVILAMENRRMPMSLWGMCCFVLYQRNLCMEVSWTIYDLWDLIKFNGYAGLPLIQCSQFASMNLVGKRLSILPPKRLPLSSIYLVATFNHR